ncbi:MAG: STAS domain-containing protein [Syntrophothermus sp.]
MAPTPFQATSSKVGAVRVIAVRGELDLATVGELEAPLSETVANGAALLIDLGECEFIDSTGIATLVRAWQQLGAEGGPPRLAIAGAGDQVGRVLEVSGVADSIPVLESRDEALAVLGG